MDLKVKDALPLHASVEVNDRYTADTSKTRVNVNLSYDNLFQLRHSLSLQYQTSPEDPSQARVIAATYVAPFAGSRNVLALYAVDTDSDVATVGTLSVLGAGRIYGARYIVPMPSIGSYSQSFTIGADFKDFKENVRLTDKTGLQTPIQYANWSATYAGNARSDNSSTSFSAGFNFGLRGLANNPAEFEDKRYKARPNYVYFRVEARHERPLLFGSTIFARAAGQFTTQPLISNEQFSIGGADSVRGYLESERLGDYGVSGAVEVRAKSLDSWLGKRVTTLYLYSFLDAGVVAIVDPLPQQSARNDLSTWGLGIRFAGLGGLEAALDWALPLVSSDNVQAGDSRIHFSVRYGF